MGRHSGLNISKSHEAVHINLKRRYMTHRKKFCERIIKIWNSLPPSIVHFELLSSFKNSLNNVNLRMRCITLLLCCVYLVLFSMPRYFYVVFFVCVLLLLSDFRLICLTVGYFIRDIMLVAQVTLCHLFEITVHVCKITRTELCSWQRSLCVFISRDRKLYL